MTENQRIYDAITGDSEDKEMYYHELTIWQDGRQITRIIGSAAQTIDEAYAERCKIAVQYHQNQIITLTTRDVPA